MKSVVINRYGGSEVLEMAEVAVPKPGLGELQVKVHACGLNPVDYKIREGALKELFPVTFPRILGGDISGVVTEVGEQSEDFKVGEEVFFSQDLDRDGGYAEYSVVNQKIVSKKPKTLSYVEAASLPVVGLTSIQALRDFGRMQPGNKVLIHAGAGGVGSFAIQYAKLQGATVFTTASTAKYDYVKSLGADRVIDYRNENFVEVCQEHDGMDIVLETIGGLNYPKSILATKDEGFVPCIVNPPDSDTLGLSTSKKIKTDFMLLRGDRKDLEEIADLVSSGKIKTTVSKLYKLENLRQAHEDLESGRTQGKLVLEI